MLQRTLYFNPNLNDCVKGSRYGRLRSRAETLVACRRPSAADETEPSPNVISSQVDDPVGHLAEKSHRPVLDIDFEALLRRRRVTTTCTSMDSP